MRQMHQTQRHERLELPQATARQAPAADSDINKRYTAAHFCCTVERSAFARSSLYVGSLRNSPSQLKKTRHTSDPEWRHSAPFMCASPRGKILRYADARTKGSRHAA